MAGHLRIAPPARPLSPAVKQSIRPATVSGKQDDIDRADEKARTGVEQYRTDHLKAVADLSHIHLQYPIFEAANVAQTIPEQYATALNARTRAHCQLARPPANHATYLTLPAGRQHLGLVPMDFSPSYFINALIRSNFE